MSGTFDVTTLAMAVDSTQVTTAAAALDKMAGAGAKAETASARMTRAAADNARTLAGSVAPAVAKVSLSFKSVAEAAQALGPGAAAKLAGAFGAAEAQAQAAARAVHELRTEVGLVGALPVPVSVGGLRGAIQQRDVEEQSRRQLDPRLAVSPTLGATGAAGAHAVVAGNEAIGKSAKLAAFQQQQLGFQLHDFFVQVASGQSPITAFVQQGSQLSGTFGGAGNAFRAVTALITPMRLAIGGAAAAVGALGIAFYEGAKQSREFADAIVLSGNFAGQTEGKFNAAAKAIAASGQVTISTAREALQALVATGQVGPQVFERAGEALARYMQATGATAAEVAKDFAGMSRDAVKWADDHNQAMHFLSAAQIEQIKAFQEAGRAADAQGVIYDALNKRLRALEPNLGLIERALRGGKGAWKDFWDAALDIGREKTLDEKLADAASRAQAAAARAASPKVAENAAGAGFVGPSIGSRRGASASAGAARAEEVAFGLDKTLAEQAALGLAYDAERQKAARAADTVIEGYLKRGKAASEYKQKLDELNRSFRDKETAGVPVSAADKKVALAELKKEFTPTGGKNNEPEQVRRETLAADLRAYQDALQQEKDAVAFQNRFLQGEYQAGAVSLQSFWDDKVRTTAQAVAAEIAELDKEKARIREDIKKVEKKDPSEAIRLQKLVDDATRQQEKVGRDAAREIALSNQQEEASFKALNEQVLNYRANLLQLQGDELGAAKLRTQIAIEQARLLAKQASPKPTTGSFARLDRGQAPEQSAVDVDGLERGLGQQNALNTVKSKTSEVNQRLAIDEERIALAQRTGAIGEIEALKMAGAARAKVVGELEKIVEEQEKIAAQIENKNNWQLQIDTSRARLELEKLKAEIDPLKKLFDDAFKGAGANFFTDLMEGKGIKGALKSFGNSIGGEINKLVGRQLSEQVFGEKGPLSGAGGFLASIFGKPKGAVTDASSARPALDTSAVSASLTNLQTVGADPATAALARLQAAADAAAGSIGQGGSAFAGPAVPGLAITGRGVDNTALPTGDFARMDRGQTSGDSAVAGLFKDADKSGSELARSNEKAATSILQFASAAARGGNAMSLLPGLIQSILTASRVSSVAGGGGGFFGALGSLFSTGSMNAAGGFNSMGFGSGAGFGNQDLGLFLHSGGIVGRTSDMRPVPRGVFADAGRYHAGGMAGENQSRSSSAATISPAPALAVNEVPAILMGGPKGKREEVLTASDPRHKDNISPALLHVLQRAPGPGKIEQMVQAARETSASPGRAFALSIIGGRGGDAKGGAGGMGGAGGRGGNASSMARGVGGAGGVGGRAMAIAFSRAHRLAGAHDVAPKASGLKSGEVPVILERNEEVLTAHDPRHRDRLTPELAGAIAAAPRYHTGGIVGLTPDRRSDVLMAVRNPYLTMPAKPATDAPGKAAVGETHTHFHITAAPGVSREQAMNQGRDIGRQIQLHGRQRARNT